MRAHLITEPEVLAVEFHPIELRDRTLLGCQIVLEHDRRRDWLAQTAQNLIWSLWSDAGPPTAVEWVDWRQGTVFNLQHAAVNSAVLESEPFLARAKSRALSFQITGAVDAFDRLLWTTAATRTTDVSNVAFRMLAPERAHTLFLEPVVGEVQRPGAVGVASPENLPMDASPFRAADFGAPPRAPAPPGLQEARTYSLPNGLTVVLAPRPGFPALTAVLGFYGGAAAIYPGVLPLVRAAESSVGSQHGAAALRTEPDDGPGYTADVVRTDRRHLSNAIYLLANRLRYIAGTDWAACSNGRSRSWRHCRRRSTSRARRPRSRCARRCTGGTLTARAPASMLCALWIRAWPRPGCRTCIRRATRYWSSAATWIWPARRASFPVGFPTGRGRSR